MTELSETGYEALARPELEALTAAIDAIEDDRVEAELASDILTLEFWDGVRYVVNSHRAARQIWMAADRSAWHFDWLAERHSWVASKSGAELWATLSELIGNKLARPITLARS